MNAQDGRKSALPPNARVAEELRGGISLVDLAAKYGVSVALVKIRLNDAGWGSDGQPNHRHPARPLLGVLDDQPWAERGLCSQTDPEEFFPEKGGSTRAAKAVCLSCEVRVKCLDYALERDERFGVWGGLSERERRRMKESA